MLTQDEELWEKELPSNVEVLLASTRDPLTDRSDRAPAGAAAPRDRTRMVSYRVPHNAAVQVYDYREKRARYRKALGLPALPDLNRLAWVNHVDMWICWVLMGCVL